MKKFIIMCMLLVATIVSASACGCVDGCKKENNKFADYCAKGPDCKYYTLRIEYHLFNGIYHCHIYSWEHYDDPKCYAEKETYVCIKDDPGQMLFDQLFDVFRKAYMQDTTDYFDSFAKHFSEDIPG